MEKNPMFEMADRLKALKEWKRELESAAAENNTEIDTLGKALSDEMAKAKVERFSRNGCTYYRTSRTFASPLNGDKETLYRTLREKGFGSLITETVNSSALGSFVKEQAGMNEGKVPEWLEAVVSTTEKESVGVRIN